jgi:hypothetical protein
MVGQCLRKSYWFLGKSFLVKKIKKGLTKPLWCDTIKIQKRKEIKAMLNFINSIPDSIGWAIVGSLMTLTAIMMVVLIKTLVQMWKDHHDEEEE